MVDGTKAVAKAPAVKVTAEEPAPEQAAPAVEKEPTKRSDKKAAPKDVAEILDDWLD
jgi:hypothetical protein